jgi:predicted RecA/RadA family phage recombinase
MATNYVQAGDRLTLTAPSTVTSGQLVAVGTNIVGVALSDAASAASVVIATEGVWNLTHAVTNTAAVVGAKAYYDTTNNAISNTTTYAQVGNFVVAKVTTTTAVTVRLNGNC